MLMVAGRGSTQDLSTHGRLTVLLAGTGRRRGIGWSVESDGRQWISDASQGARDGSDRRRRKISARLP